MTKKPKEQPVPPVEKISTLDIAAKADWEGLDYAIQNYFLPEQIADPVLAKKWGQAKVLLKEIQQTLDNASANDPNPTW